MFLQRFAKTDNFNGPVNGGGAL